MATKTYGVGDAAEKENTGVPVGANSRMQPGGKVLDKEGNVAFDPEDDAVELKGSDEHPGHRDGVDTDPGSTGGPGGAQ